MRQKDAETVATILGTELRTCASVEVVGLLTAVGAIEGHMLYAHPEFDPKAYHEAIERAAGCQVSWSM